MQIEHYLGMLNQPPQLHTDLVINGIKRCLGNADHPVEVRANACTFAARLLQSKTEDFRQVSSTPFVI